MTGDPMNWLMLFGIISVLHFSAMLFVGAKQSGETSKSILVTSLFTAIFWWIIWPVLIYDKYREWRYGESWVDKLRKGKRRD